MICTPSLEVGATGPTHAVPRTVPNPCFDRTADWPHAVLAANSNEPINSLESIVFMKASDLVADFPVGSGRPATILVTKLGAASSLGVGEQSSRVLDVPRALDEGLRVPLAARAGRLEEVAAVHVDRPAP